MKRLKVIPILFAFAGASEANLKREALCMAQAMFAEANGQGQQGVVAVAHVVKRRTKIEHKSACAVVRRGQFAKASIPAKLLDAYLDTALKVLLGRIADPTGGATHFFKWGTKTPTWYDRRRSKRIRDHVFVNVASVKR